VDGSSIDVDRHLPLDCYLVNLGWILVQYGAMPCFQGDTRVELQPVGEELLVRDADDPSRESAIAGTVLEVVRSVWELGLLAEQAERFATRDRPLLALLDGNLALWNLDKPGLPASTMDALKAKSVDALDRLKALAESRTVIFSGFVSGTGAANLAHSLRLAECPLEHVVCRACPGKDSGTRPCDAGGAPNDAEIFKLLLGRWQRSAVFLPYRAYAPGTAESWYAGAGHDIAFFYLNVGGEIARIELPRWMTEDAEQLSLLHALLVAQTDEGGLYPLVLQEAHEQAVISTGDRACFAAMLEREGELTGIPWLVSAKAMSKRIRAI
jgi:NurA domain